MSVLQRLDERLLPAWAVVPAPRPAHLRPVVPGPATLRSLDDRVLPVWAAALRRVLGR